MSRRFLRVVFLIWLGWYLAGPLIETFDSWDTPQEEMSDIASSAAGALIWAAAGICIAVLFLQQLCRRCGDLAGTRINVPLLLQRFSTAAHRTVGIPTPFLDTSQLRV